MINRQERIIRAESIIIANPNISKRGLQSQLKTEFGVGLSDTTRRGLLQKANTVNVLWSRVNSPAFTHHDRIVLRKALRQAGNAPYVIKAINDRFAHAKELYRQGWTIPQIRKAMRTEAKEKGTLATVTTRTKDKPDGTVKGQVDWWRVLRDYRDKDIDRGEYIPPAGSKGGKRPTALKGDLKAQKARYDDKQSTKAHARWVERERTRIKTWIIQKDKAIAVSSGDHRIELEAQKANLQRTLENIR